MDAYISGDLNVEGSMEAAVALGDVIGRRLREPGALRQLTRLIFALPVDDDPAIRRTRFQRVSGSITRKRRRSDAQAIEFHYCGSSAATACSTSAAAGAGSSVTRSGITRSKRWGSR